MGLLDRKSNLDRLLATVSDSLNAANALKGALPDGLRSGKPLKTSLPTGKSLKAAIPRGTALKAGLVAGGLAGLTAGSAGISSLRRRREGAAGHP
jgi:hypothetical protein